MDLDYKKTVAMLMEKNRLSPETIVESLSKHEFHLYRVRLNYSYTSIVLLLIFQYLHEFDKKNPKGEYHRELVRLYALYDREKLLPFLKKSEYYPIQEALDICQKEKYYPEMVFLLGEMK